MRNACSSVLQSLNIEPTLLLMQSAEMLNALSATKRAASLAKDHDHRLHIVHLTSQKEADWLQKNKGDLITTEVCTST